MTGVSFVVPVHNGARWLDGTLAAIFAQLDGDPRAAEVIAVEDGSTDGSRAILERWVARGVRLADGPRRGAAAAINTGVRLAQNPIVCQVDQDVILAPGWLASLTAALDEPGVAAAQGWYEPAAHAGRWARAMGRDLEQRYLRIRGRYVDHVCTGNTAYRKDALHAVGLFDESFGYGYDNDMSYRLGAAGYRLVFCRDARSAHQWREGAWGYLKQQYGQGYGRIDLVGKHRRKLAGDDVSNWAMMIHAPLMALALAGLAAAAIGGALAAAWWRAAAIGSVSLIGLLAAERFWAGLRAARQFRDASTLWFVPAHLLRDLAWVAAVGAWTLRWLRGKSRSPTDSM